METKDSCVLSQQENLMAKAITLDTDYLAHHGTKGMKWGVWNAETRAKYLGGARVKSTKQALAKYANKKVKTLKKEYKKKAAAFADSQAKKAEEKAEQKAIRKELGMSKQQYEKLRQTTLKSHDPAVVAKGMHTLTDSELDSKIKRLRKEEEVSKMATDKSKRISDQKRARNEALRANPFVNAGINLADAKARQVLGISGKNKDKKNKNKNDDNNNSSNNNNNGNNSSNKGDKKPKASSKQKSSKSGINNSWKINDSGMKSGSKSGISNSWKINDSGMKSGSKSGINNSWKINDSGMKKVRDAAANVSIKKTPATNRYERVGRKLLTDGSVRAQVISIKTIDDRK